METVGLRRALIERNNFPKLTDNVLTPDFIGWPIYTHKDTPEALVTDICRALEVCKDRIPWAKKSPLPLEQMVQDSAEGHLEVPLHPAAERFWQERGYI